MNVPEQGVVSCSVHCPDCPLSCSRPHPLPDSSELLHIRNSHYKQDAVAVRRHFQQQYGNWTRLEGSRSSWWLWTRALEEIRRAMEHIHSYLDRSSKGKTGTII